MGMEKTMEKDMDITGEGLRVWEGFLGSGEFHMTCGLLVRFQEKILRVGLLLRCGRKRLLPGPLCGFLVSLVWNHLSFQPLAPAGHEG